MRRASPSIFVCLSLLSLVVLVSSGARADESADDCVRMQESPREGGLELSVDNHCRKRLACALSWTVQCESATGRVTKRSKDGARLLVSVDASQTAFASAKNCGDNWKIEHVSWDCAPAN